MQSYNETKMETLLQKALKLKSNKKIGDITNEEYELGLAWAKGKINYRQIQSVMGYKNANSAYVLLARSFKRYVEENEK